MTNNQLNQTNDLNNIYIGIGILNAILVISLLVVLLIYGKKISGSGMFTLMIGLMLGAYTMIVVATHLLS